jgi:hypothetical protein
VEKLVRREEVLGQEAELGADDSRQEVAEELCAGESGWRRWETVQAARILRVAPAGGSGGGEPRRRRRRRRVALARARWEKVTRKFLTLRSKIQGSQKNTFFMCFLHPKLYLV